MISCVEYLEATEKRFPDKTAVVDTSGRYSFSDLRSSSIRMANLIPELPSNSPIAVLLPKSFDALTAFLGVLYSRNFYAPVDPKIPVERIATILSDLRPRVIITRQKFAAQAESLAGEIGAEVLLIEDASALEWDEPSESRHMRWQKGVDTDPVYCIYTSGSTGDPKGVMISHRCVFDFIDWVEETFAVDEAYVLGNQSPLVFDVSVLDIYSMLKCGCEMHFIPEMFFSFPAKLLDYVVENRINFIIWVPSVLINVANSGILDGRDLANLKFVLFAGEVMPCKQLNSWIRAVPSAGFGNLYGPTEATVIATYYMVDREFEDGDSLPIGKACKNVEAHVLNEAGEFVGEGEIGELCLRGSSLAMGYLGDREKTDQAFIQTPVHDRYVDLLYRPGDLVERGGDGNLLYLGRKDSQIKHMGYRIELGDIENVLGGFEDLEHWCVVYDKEKSEIVVFYVGRGQEIEDRDLRSFLAAKLPRYMVPARFIEKTNLPTNQSGKIDRRLLIDTLASGEEA
ncbi:MAG: amino acid adenylation domain-containing protein [Verrucomicrobiota bacterium]